MNAREQIFSKIKEATQGLEEVTPMPSSEEIRSMRPRQVPTADDFETLAGNFSQRWEEAHGKQYADWSELLEFLKSKEVKRGYADPQAAELLGASGLPIEFEYKRADVDAFDFSITMADIGVAETGSIVLTDRGTSNRLAALACWIHVAVLPRQKLVASLGDAMELLGDDPSIIVVTGPSKTADIEGVLIEGVHGPGIQICVIV